MPDTTTKKKPGRPRDSEGGYLRTSTPFNQVQLQKMETVCRQLGISRAELIRRALDEYYKKKGL